ncbi:probable 2-oxoglutarate-dependent dioxygenase AOP1 [Dioscorea cayenensis subsp. rotundata]|uniref:Probable 2-oxoglutarate-dependent dioxygenase AOP1 n=1 Tax=Dioscorea cayennensis subsp. rotundata TaxID=55577 RepID=A0AB40AVB3_DIOCR|nr:probable 2-oxoglutarate-dependent dioxygenase AOP1 [Dioscorea cayenensis subsp. rotundata]
MATSPSPSQSPTTFITHLHIKKPSSLYANQWSISTLECQKVQKALETHGFFLVKYHDDQEQEQDECSLLHETFSSLNQLFNLPRETKLKNSSLPPYYTYFRTTVYETLAVVNSFSSSGQLLSFTQLMWPHGNQKFYETMRRMSGKLIELSKIILCMLCKSYGVIGRTELDHSAADHEATMDPLFRMMKYSAPLSNNNNDGDGDGDGDNDEDEEPILRLTPHTDQNFVTVLCQNEVDGLMCKSRDGEWMKVNPSPGSFIVLAGDALRVWSNGRIHAPLHKVMMKGKKDRLSFGMFVGPKGDKVVEVFDEFVDEEEGRPAIFKPFIFLDYLNFSLENVCRAETMLDSFECINSA